MTVSAGWRRSPPPGGPSATPTTRRATSAGRTRRRARRGNGSTTAQSSAGPDTSPTSTTHRGASCGRRASCCPGERGSGRYAWDAEDRLTQVTTPDGRRWAYVYDGLGRRVAKRLLSDAGLPVEETVFTWDGSHLVEQSSSAGGPTRNWEWAPGTDRALLQVDQDEVDRRFYAIVTDLVGTPTELVDEEGRIAWRARTTLWGTPVGGPAGPVDCPLRFPGQYHDPETGLHYNFRRYYDPENARYISPDPLGLAPAPNHHAYVLRPPSLDRPVGAGELREQQARHHGATGGPHRGPARPRRPGPRTGECRPHGAGTLTAR